MEQDSPEPTPPEGEEGTDEQNPEVQSLRRENAKRRTQLREAEARIAEMEKAAMTEQERAVAEAREQAIAEVRAEMQAEVQAARMLALAAPVLRDPEDATRFITDLPADADDATIKAALGALVKEKPYLALESPEGPSIAQGRRSEGVAADSADDWLRATLRNR